MNIRLTVLGDRAATDLGDVRALLDCEPELRGQVRVEEHAIRPGDLGGLSDTLAIALGAQGAVAVFAASLRVLFAQPRRADFRIVLTLPDGTKVEVDAKRAKEIDIAELIRQTKGTAQ
ncbi:hypothetical protein [Kitasatospora sp. CB02891]|uniref:effector-associated constant component EACC1 n=1 Tax=Kitasatospora sp. CB02891 TaxID=2020329 RepID=UPI000C27C6D9|nr:hypothetical protein [Kitasatospora sp. CB02891]PJN21107.1 hypothetical protein CG736_35240 [Kitasatospora sp. CB02891]